MTAKRYEHYLPPISGGRFPDMVGVLICKATSHRYGKSYDRIVEGIDLCVYKFYSISESGWQFESGGGLTEPIDLWALLRVHSKQFRNIWLFTPCGIRSLNLLDVWKQLEMGNISVNATNEKASKDGRKRKRKRYDGTIIAEPNCTIFKAKLMPSMSRITIVDPANYGMHFADNPEYPARQLDEVTDAVKWYMDTLRENNLGGLAPTAASQAMRTLRYRFMKHPVLCHANKTALQLEQDAYVGGRCEVYRMGPIKEKLYHLDYRSMYPSIYSECTLPTRLIATGYGRDSMSETAWDEHAGVIANCRITTDQPDYPVRHNGMVVYPVGTFYTTLCGPELHHARVAGRVDSIQEWSAYEMKPLLAEYGKAIYRLRENLDMAKSSYRGNAIKALLVAICGKFGQRTFSWEDKPNYCADMPYGRFHYQQKEGGIKECRVLSWLVSERSIPLPANDACFAIAAWITSLGRMKLLKSISLALREHTVYVDTDALIVTEAGYQLLSTLRCKAGSSIGSLIQKGTSDDSEFYGVKHYRFGGRYVCSGLPEYTGYSSESTKLFIKREKPHSIAMGGIRPTAQGKLQPFSRINPYTHGITRPDGRVEPIILGNAN